MDWLVNLVDILLHRANQFYTWGWASMSGLPENGHGCMSARPNPQSFPPPTLGKRRHRSLAGCGISGRPKPLTDVRELAVDVSIAD
jgi:hypothetical protein